MEDRRGLTSITALPHEVLVRVLAPLGVPEWARIAQTSQAFRAAAASYPPPSPPSRMPHAPAHSRSNFACTRALGGVTFVDLKHAGASLDATCFAALCSRLSQALMRVELDMWHLDDTAVLQLPGGIRELALCGCDHHSDALLDCVASRFGPNLRWLAWSGFGGSVSDAGFLRLARSCPNLTTFAIDSGSSIDANAIVRALASSCRHLDDLSCYDLDKETFAHMKRCGVRLRRLRHKRRHAHGLPLTDVSLCMLVGMCPLLEELTLVDKTDGVGSGEVTDVGLLALAERSATLRVLRLKLNCPAAAARCSEVAVMELASACTRLTHLELNNFRRLTDPPVCEIVQRCSGIVELGLDAAPITDASLDVIASNCPHLRNLSIKSCRQLTEHGYKVLAAQCTRLEAVNAGQAAGITDAAVVAMCLAAAGLKSLVLNYGQLSDTALRAIGGCSQMQELALHSCPRITNQGLRELATGCPQLRYLSISYCDHVSDSGVVAIAASCTRLLKIRLDNCRLLSNPCVRALCCQPGGRLRYLSMQHCYKLSDAVFPSLLAGASLRFVDLGRGKLSETAMAAYHKQKPLVEFCIDGIQYAPPTSSM